MKARVVIGANLGDEGKGTVVATYTKHAKGKVLNVLTNGGAQRAHSILTENGNFTFQHFGSGTYHGADNYYSCFYILNPIQFAAEYNPNFDVKLFRDPNCRWSTPYDMMANLIIESERGLNRHGSCGMGIWRTVLRYQKMTCMSFGTFMKLEIEQQIEYLKSIKRFHEGFIGTISDEWKTTWNDPGIITHFLKDCEFLFNRVQSRFLSQVIESYKYDEIIFENGQGLMLTDNGRNELGTTPSCTGVANAQFLIKQLDIEDRNISYHYVTRPYLTRHGKGYINQECDKSKLSSFVLDDRTNHYNDNQGEFRYGWLDLEDLTYRILKDSRKVNPLGEPIIELTHCDELDRLREFKNHFSTIRTYDTPLIK